MRYAENYDSYRSKYYANGIENNFIKMHSKNSDIFYVAEYHLNGSLISFKQSSLARFQQCDLLVELDYDQKAYQKCSVSVESLLTEFGSRNTVFYELYMKVDEL